MLIMGAMKNIVIEISVISLNGRKVERLLPTRRRDIRKNWVGSVSEK